MVINKKLSSLILALTMGLGAAQLSAQQATPSVLSIVASNMGRMASELVQNHWGKLGIITITACAGYKANQALTGCLLKKTQETDKKNGYRDTITQSSIDEQKAQNAIHALREETAKISIAQQAATKLIGYSSWQQKVFACWAPNFYTATQNLANSRAFLINQKINELELLLKAYNTNQKTFTTTAKDVLD